MLNPAFIAENKQQVITALEKRATSYTSQIDQVIELNTSRKKMQLELDEILGESNALSKEIGILYKSGEADKANELKTNTSALKEKSKSLEPQLKEIEAQLQSLLYKIPNIPAEDVKFGKSDADNEFLEERGQKPTLAADAVPHWDLIEKYDLIDFPLGVKITGAGFPVYKGKGAQLQRGLINFFLQENIKAGYQDFFLPYLINEASGIGTGQLPDKDAQMYHAKEDNLYIIPTGEVPMMNIYRDVILKAEDLPVKATTHTPCFRREAGSWGADVRGLNRLHQFEKVEIVQITKPEDSWDALTNMCDHVAGLLDKLQLPYRILRLCGGDMGVTASMTYDFEVWSAGQQRWLEVSSVSNCTDYQSNRMKLRYKENNKTHLCHSLNGSALALPRIMAALLENNQSESGIQLPEALHGVLGFDEIS